MQINQLPTECHVELEDNCIDSTIAFFDQYKLWILYVDKNLQLRKMWVESMTTIWCLLRAENTMGFALTCSSGMRSLTECSTE
jgi:hypothetical protein